MGLFSFIECAVAQGKMKDERELKRAAKEGMTMEDVRSAFSIGDDIERLGYEKAMAMHLGDFKPLTAEETANFNVVKEILDQQTQIPKEHISIAAEMIAKVQTHEFDNTADVVSFLKSSGKTDDEINIYNTAVVALSNTPWYSQSLAMQDQSIVDGIQEVVGQMTPQHHIPPQQTGFQVPPQFVTPVAPNAIAK